MENVIASSDRYVRTIRVLCSIIHKRIKSNGDEDFTEYKLRKALTGCIMGSQVRYEMAQSAVDTIERAGLFNDTYWVSTKYNLESLVYDALTRKDQSSQKKCSYRFPRLRAQQLNKTKLHLLDSGISLIELVFKYGDEKALRRELIAMIPGLGPKQASMFLRNVSRSYDLAVLDTHVLRFMGIQKIIGNACTSIGSIAAYERLESKITNYSELLGYPVGYMDWAIWATMRAAWELRL